MEETSNILPKYVIEKPTPSAADGVTAEVERLHRTFGCELIIQSGSVLNLPQVVVITGQNILNRFFYRKSLQRFDAFSIAIGSLLLASKVEECFKTLREILFAFHFVYGKRKGLRLKPMELGGQQYTMWKNELIMVERYILKELGFSLYNIMDHPHKYILYFVRVLNGSKSLATTAWNYLNDSMRLDISLRFEAQTIACAAIYLASRTTDTPLPLEDDCGLWTDVFGADMKSMLAVCDEILSIYDMKKIGWLEPLCEVEFISPQMCAEFDQIIPDTYAGSIAPQATPVPGAADSRQQIPFQNSSAVMLKADEDGTPKVGDDAVESGGSTPIVAMDVEGGQEAGPPRKLERKWMSVVGDIDQLDAVPPQAPQQHPQRENPQNQDPSHFVATSKKDSKRRSRSREFYQETSETRRNDPSFRRRRSGSRSRDRKRHRSNSRELRREAGREKERYRDRNSRDRASDSFRYRESSRDNRIGDSFGYRESSRDNRIDRDRDRDQHHREDGKIRERDRDRVDYRNYVDRKN